MRVDKARLRYNFGRRAGGYDAVAGVQQELAACLGRRLPALALDCRRLLEIGCGTGYYTAILRQVFPEARITAVDLAPEALVQAKNRLGTQNNISWQLGDGETEFWGEFDLITANSVFQWFTDPAAALLRLQAQLLPGGYLAFTAFGPATFQELAASLTAAAQITGRPPRRLPAQDFPTAGQWRSYLERAGFIFIELQEDLRTRSYPDLWTLLQDIRQMGATSTHPAYLPRRLLAAATAHYERHFRPQGRLRVSYQTLLAVAQRPGSSLPGK